MKFLYKINGVTLDTITNKDSAIRAARKAALTVNDKRDIIHLEVYTIDEEGMPVEMVHRDMVLIENIKQLVTDNLEPVGTVQFTKHVKEKTVTKKEELYEEGDYVLINDEIHQIISVSESRAMAQPLAKKQVHIKDKFTEKDRKFSIKRKAVPISPIRTGVLSKKDALERLKKEEDANDIKESRRINSDASREPREGSGDSGDGVGHTKDA